jgi:5'-deoxynucleotidase YfbR-like HD superfamily hydrolase
MLPRIETRSGIGFWPLSPHVEDIHIGDIAHALSNQCRFSGHTREFYSVAEHCVRVSELLEEWGWDRGVQLWGLLHDASEAYLVDVPSPLKCADGFALYRASEEQLMSAIAIRFEIPLSEPAEVCAADGVMLATEARDLMAYRPEHWQKLTHEPLAETIVPWTHETARHNFLSRFRHLTMRDTEPSPSYEDEGPKTLRPTGDET